MNPAIIATLQEYYEELETIDFTELFISTYNRSTVQERLALVINFMNNWYDADYTDIPRLIAEIN